MRNRIALVMLALAALDGNLSAQSADTEFQITTVSARPEFVSGGDVLVRVSAPAAVAPDRVQVMLDGADVTASLRPDGSGGLTGLLTGLRVGRSTLSVTAAGDSRSARLDLLNHPIVGPVFSGPHEAPFICQTEQFKLQSGELLGQPLDEDCSIATRVDYYYKSTAGGPLKPLPGRLPPSPRLRRTGTPAPATAAIENAPGLPPDVAQVTTTTEATVPFIVRIETGTINRAVYQIAMLHNPATEPQPGILTRPAGWNGRLIYTFGGGCVGGWYRQGDRTGGVVDEVMLQRGYAVASASLNVFGNNCAELLAAETMMMVKERFIEAYGPPKFTIGWGGSGGSYQQHQIADGYPGLLDGIMPARSFPDLAFGTVPFITDARLLNNYFTTLAALPYTSEQQRRISGFGTLETMKAVDEGAGRISPMEHCPEVLPREQRYHPSRNPTGARCDVYDHAINVYGRDEQTGFARRPLDNVGVQYGLAALNDGTITKAQFLELNEKIGGYDNDGQIVPGRTEGDLTAIRAAYRSGLLISGGRGLATTPIVDYRAYMDDDAEGNVHVRYHSFSLRERLLKANGYADNHVMLTDDRKWGDSLRAPVLRDALSQMDAWLTRIADDTSDDSKLEKLRRARPADLVDACWTRDENPQKIAEPAQYGAGRCEALYPANSFPRGVAGSPVAAGIVKCQLNPVSAADYAVTFTADEMARLRRIFPAGVCDWSKPGVEQQAPAGTWQRFGTDVPAQTAAREFSAGL